MTKTVYKVEIIYLKKELMMIKGKLKMVDGFFQNFKTLIEARRFLNVFLEEDKRYQIQNGAGLINEYALNRSKLEI